MLLVFVHKVHAVWKTKFPLKEISNYLPWRIILPFNFYPGLLPPSSGFLKRHAIKIVSPGSRQNCLICYEFSNFEERLDPGFLKVHFVKIIRPFLWIVSVSCIELIKI